MSASAGLERAAVSMLRTLGGRKAALLIAQPAIADGQCGLGLAAPQINEVDVEPVLLRAAGKDAKGNGKTLYALMTQCTVHKALSLAQASDSSESATKQALESSMLRLNETDYYIRSVTVKWSGGLELLYELEIEE